jgi:hypothetical protein
MPLSYVYSLFRVFGVYLLALKGEYEFSKSKMVLSLSREYPNSRLAVLTLSELRTLNANFFAGASPDLALGSIDKRNALPEYVAALAETVNEEVRVSNRSYGDAVEEFRTAVAPYRSLNYRLRMWFLLLVYDGLNLFCRKSAIRPLTSFHADRLEALLSASVPPAVSGAAEQVLSHIRDYRLKYFLSDRTRVEKETSINTLSALR